MRDAVTTNIGAAEIAVQGAVEIPCVLKINGQIQAELVANSREGLRVGFRSRHGDRRIRRDHECDRKSDDRGSDQHRDAEHDSAYQKSEHGYSEMVPRAINSRRSLASARSRWRQAAGSAGSSRRYWASSPRISRTTRFISSNTGDLGGAGFFCASRCRARQYARYAASDE